MLRLTPSFDRDSKGRIYERGLSFTIGDMLHRYWGSSFRLQSCMIAEVEVWGSAGEEPQLWIRDCRPEIGVCWWASLSDVRALYFLSELTTYSVLATRPCTSAGPQVSWLSAHVSSLCIWNNNFHCFICLRLMVGVKTYLMAPMSPLNSPITSFHLRLYSLWVRFRV
jgi:hypothetical protein